MKSSRMRPILFLVAILAIAEGFQFPDIGDFFSNLHRENAEKKAEEPRSRSKRGTIGDENSADPWEVISSSLPTKSDKSVNTRYMPTISNGHIATTVYGDSIYMEGLYSGERKQTHRARIPPTIMARVNLSDPEMERQVRRKFSFDSKYGIFYENVTTDFAVIHQKIYMHQKLIRLFVVDMYAEKRNIGSSVGGGVIQRKYRKINETKDIKFLTEARSHNANWEIKGRPGDAGLSDEVSIFWSDPVTQYAIRGTQKEYRDTMVMSIDRHEGNARSEFDEAMLIINTKGADHLLKMHKDAWDATWDEGRVEIMGNQQINKISNFAQYYLLSAMPAMDPKTGDQNDHIHTGTSRTGLAWGGANDLHGGHVMWDSEIYILPAVLLFHPVTVREVLRFRTGTADAAKITAERYGAEGYHYAWESALTGMDVSPNSDICPVCSWRKYHVTGAVAWAIRQYYSATMDDEYSKSLLYDGCDISREIARFFADRAVYDPSAGRYNLVNVTGPDEHYINVNNNAYTMVLASLAIHWARYYSCICNRNSRDEIPDDWVHKATLFNLPFNNIQRLHYPHDGFDPEKDNKVKQADTVMLTYPLNWNMSHDIMRNDLDFYELLMDDDTPAMTWSWFTVGYKMVQEDLKMTSFFHRSYQDYMQDPFKIWTEYKEGVGSNPDTKSSVNFLPGMGGFMQSIIYGFAGIRVRPQMLEFHNPTPPPDSSELRLWGLKYLGNKLNIFIEQTGSVTIEVVKENAVRPLVLRYNDTSAMTKTLRQGAVEQIEKAQVGFYIFTERISGCEHPRDYIYMPWGYSPFIDASPMLTPSLVVMNTLFSTCHEEVLFDRS
ncbi:hypothetical protein CAPTEDRAFT_222476 [Capitella teleta]|uniref:Protein-glucosylgalactosylhydroxylysine glucosidase n=1 Tax=Capitella teleta TaxID=283909 RepID=R7UEB2_CAPTE|nr:hypothetical protein CAPTEDRAFT_222476 [Capitella teleta]|eukprot:ELU02128.1 hypothetical protein CAPTEDRAFT_222476 [Capitella teleta]